MKAFKVTAQGDTVYVKADSEDKAYERMCEAIGSMPRTMLKFNEIKESQLPEEEVWL